MTGAPDSRLPNPIAIDGPAASGKSSVGAALARRHGYRFLDTGLMYRAFALAALRAGIPAADEAAASELARKLDMRVETSDETRIFLDGEDVTGELRTPPVEDVVSSYSKIAAVREVMVACQREIAAEGLAVVAGRDIGTVVLPDAPLKFFLDASPEARAVRRQKQAGEDGDERARNNIAQRDAQDAGRAVAPMAVAPGAIKIDTTAMALEDVVDMVMRRVEHWRAEHRAPAPGPLAVYGLSGG